MRRRTESKQRSLIAIEAGRPALPPAGAPLAELPAPDAVRAQDGDFAAKPCRTIVVAEDDEVTRLVLSRVLSREGLRVVAVENGRLACEAVRKERPDVVLLDWVMPVMDGRAALEELKAHPETRGIPIVMLTSHAQVDDRILALESGVQDFLSKPVDPRELVACIEQQLRWRNGLAVDADVAFGAERDALRAASERRYRMLAEAMPHSVWIADALGHIAYFNRAWCDFSGGLPAGPLTQAWASTIHPDDRAAALDAWTPSLQSGRPYETQCRLRRSDGAYRWHVVRAMPMRDEDGAVVEWIGSCSDIHDYRIAAEARAILDTMSSMVAIRTDDGAIDYAGPHWANYTGSTSASALGFGWRDFVHPDDRAVAHHRRDAGPEQYEFRLRGADGTYRWFLAQTEMLPGVAGSPRRWLDTAIDVDDLKRTQSALATSEAQYRALTDSVPQMVWVTGADAGFEYVNARWREYTGSTLEATRSPGYELLVHADDRNALLAVHAAPRDGEFTCEARFRRHDGVYRWHSVRAMPFADAAGGTSKWIATATDIEDSKAAAALLARTAAKLEHLAHHDPMTNLPNRALLGDRLNAAIALAQRAKSEVIVLYVDLDRFKIVNDTRGHAAGDRVLAVTGARITEALRSGDTASRVGGDEFVLVCAAGEATGEGARLATRLLAAIGQPIDIEGEAVTIGASIGISMYPADGIAGDDLIGKADSAMYIAKESGRNAFRFYAHQAHHSIVAVLDFEAELQHAIEAGEIVIYYQPILGLHDNELIGAEALVRWKHPTRGLLGPPDFLAFAQANRLVGDISAIVLDAVCAQIARLGENVPDGFRVSMNVFASQLMHPGWVQSVAAALAAHGADPRRLQIEIAETIVMSEPASVIAIFAELRTLGIALSIDDFGTGLSSLATIKNFPLNTLKIDRSFVRDIATDSGDQAVAKTIITLAHSLGINAVAAGVETSEQIETLRAYGSDGFQGFLASRPMASDDFSRFVATYAAPAPSPPAL